MDAANLRCKAWQFHSNGLITESLSLDDVVIHSAPSRISRLFHATLGPYGPHPGILIQVAAASLNPVDYKMIYPGSATFLVHKPGIPGSDFSGVIVGWIGNKKDTFSTALGLEIGSRVYGHLSTPWRMLLGTGTLSQYIVAYPPMVLPLPTNLSFEQSSTVYLAGITSWQALVDHGKLKAGQRIFINGGSGGTGVWAIQIAKALGAHVVSTCSSASKELLESLHVDELVNYQENSIIPYLTEHYAIPSSQFDIIYDCIGSDCTLFDACPSFLRADGKFLDITSMADSKGILGHARDAGRVVKNVTFPRVLGGTPRKYVPVVLQASSGGEAFKKVDGLLRKGKIRPIIDSTYSFEDVPAAFERLMSGRAKGKIVIRVSDELCQA